jgi:RNA polymerase sigma factor for flagellar operon FliA
VKLLPLVKRIAFKLRQRLPAHVELDDLVGAGVLGLLDAVRKFDPRKDVQIESYARHRIRGAILESLRSLDPASRDMRRKSKQAEKVYWDLEARVGRPVTDPEMAQALGITLEEWYRTLWELQVLDLDWLRPVGSVGRKQTYENTQLADHQASPFDLCYRREQREILTQAVAHLRERERMVISLYYLQGLTMKQIATQLGVDESRISQLCSAALDRLRLRVQAMLRRPQPARALPRAGVSLTTPPALAS